MSQLSASVIACNDCNFAEMTKSNVRQWQDSSEHPPGKVEISLPNGGLCTWARQRNASNLWPLLLLTNTRAQARVM